MQRHKLESPLLELLEQRYKDLKLGYKLPYIKPDLIGQEDRVSAAVREHSKADNSDPFAALRVSHYIKQGYVLASDVLHDAKKVIASHGENGVFSVLA